MNAEAEALRAELARVTAEREALREALTLFANLDNSVPSSMWAINPEYCEQARAALSNGRA